MCTKIKGKYYSKKFNVTSNINYLPSHSLFIPPLNISTHNGNPFQNKSFHGASSGSILVLNNPRNIDQPSIIRIFKSYLCLMIPLSCSIGFWCTSKTPRNKFENSKILRDGVRLLLNFRHLIYSFSSCSK